MSERSITIDPAGGEVLIDLRFGDGIICEWTLRLEGDGSAARTWTGNTRDEIGDFVRLPAAALPVGSNLSWMAVFFGPGESVGFHWGVRVQQGGASVLSGPWRGSGTVKARRTKVVSGSIAVVVA